MKLIKYIVFALLIANTASAQMTTRVVRDSLFIPWELVYGPDSHIWFTQKNGYICRMEPTSGYIDTLYHETNTSIRSEGGMLGMALHPNFSTDPYVYVAYNYSQGTYKEHVVRYTYNGNTLGSPLILLDDIPSANFHNGCRMIIVNNQLYLTTGDATVTSNSQDLSSINGKILRINLDGSIPTDNPIAGSPIWSWGHRNPQGLVYANGIFYSSEHGPNNDDEVNIIHKGRNYGWPDVQGYCNTPGEQTFCNDSNVVEPIQAWTPTIAVSGIDYYNHSMLPAFQNAIIMATLKDSKLHVLNLNNTHDSVIMTSTVNQVNYGRLRDVCISPGGSIFISTSNSNAGGNVDRTDKIIELYDPSFNSVSNVNGDNDITLYPNPAHEYITIAPLPQLAYKYQVVNALGQIMLTGNIDKSSPYIATEALPNGAYTLHLISDNISKKNIPFIKR